MPAPIAAAGGASPAVLRAPLPAAASFGAALRGAPAAGPGAIAPAPGPARQVLQAVERARSRLDGALAAARKGRTFTAPELLALQADAYLYSQTLEVAAKVVEQGAQAVKQAVHTPV